jgi:hypothetical protein
MAFDSALRFITTIATRALSHGALPSAITRRPTATAEVPQQAALFAAIRTLLLWAMYGRRPRCRRNLTISEAFGCGHVFGL